MDNVQHAGVAIIAVILILREIKPLILGKKPDAKDAFNSVFKILRKTESQIQALYDCHLGPQALDLDGAPKWYVRSALPEAVESIGTALNALNETLRDIHRDHQQMQAQLDRIEAKAGH